MQDEIRKRILKRKKRRIRRKIIKVTTGLTALTLTCSLALEQYYYKRSDKFYFVPDIKGNVAVSKNNYISCDHIDKYYVIELYHKGLNKSRLYIASRFEYNNGSCKYNNIFDNYFIAYDDDINDSYEFVNVIPLHEILEKYNLNKEKYYYNDMLQIYRTIQNNYEFADTSIYQEPLEEDKILIKKRTLG